MHEFNLPTCDLPHCLAARPRVIRIHNHGRIEEQHERQLEKK